MTRKIIPIQSAFNSTNVKTYIPVGSRLHSVNGECSTKTTYDFTVSQEIGTVGGGAQIMQVKFCGVPNGRAVHLWKEYPMLTNLAAVPTAGGHIAISTQAGSGVSLQVYYANGVVDVA